MSGLDDKLPANLNCLLRWGTLALLEKATVKGLGREMALLDLVGKMYSKIQPCWRGSGRNPTDTEDTKIDPM